MKGAGRPGGRIEYRGDLPNLVAANYDPMRDTSIGRRMRIPGVAPSAKSAVVSRKSRRGDHSFYTYGGYVMQRPIPGPPAYGQVMNSSFQRVNKRLFFWQQIRTLFEAGYPRNLGLSHRQAQPVTNASGGAGTSVMTQRPLFTRVQQVPRSRAVVPTYNTRSAR